MLIWDQELPELSASSPPPPPSAAAAAGPRGERSARPPRQPRLYVYDDLPAALQEPCLWPLTCLLHAKARSSAQRTLDPAQADYFWVPHKYPLESEAELDALLRFVTHERPWFNASLAADAAAGRAARARTILAFSCDHGPSPCFWSAQPCATPAGLARWRAEVNPASRSRALLFLQLSGKRDGGDAGDGRCCAGCFQRGKDVVLPPMTPGREWNFVDSAKDTADLSPWLGGEPAAAAFIATGASRPGAPRRDVSLWFAGSLMLSERPESDASGRMAAFAAVLGAAAARAGAGGEVADWAGLGRVSLTNTLHASAKGKTYPFERWAARSTVCLDPMGWAGGWAARYIALLAFGCVPLNSRPAAVALPFEEHPAVDWAAFALTWPSPHGENYSATLAEVLGGVLAREGAAGAAAAARLRALRAAGREAYTRFLWTSVNPVADEMARYIRLGGGHADGGEEEAPPDAWETLMELLGWRLVEQ